MDSRQAPVCFKGRYTRGYIPHHDFAGATLGITFRLADSVPARLLRAYASALEGGDRPPSDQRIHDRVRSHMERYLAKGRGSCLLRDPGTASIVEQVLRAGDPAEYSLMAWVVMPNHVHVVIRRTAQSTLAQIVRRWKGRSARSINAALGRTGPLWFRDYFDRDLGLRDDEVRRAIRYVELNPVKAGLCHRPQDWAFSSAGSGGEQAAG